MNITQLNTVKNTVLEQTPQARRIIAALYDRADWTTRDELAKRLGKRRLNPHDIGLLDRLAACGLLEIKKRERPGRIGFEFIYRIDWQVHRGLNLLRQQTKAKNA